MQILQLPHSSLGLTVLKNIFFRFIDFKHLKMVWKKSSLIWIFPLILAENPLFFPDFPDWKVFKIFPDFPDQWEPCWCNMLICPHFQGITNRIPVCMCNAQGFAFLSYGLFPPTEMETETDPCMESFPDCYIVLCRTFSTGTEMETETETETFPDGYCTNFRDGSPSQGHISIPTLLYFNEGIGICVCTSGKTCLVQ